MADDNNKTPTDIFNARELNDIALKHLDSLFAKTGSQPHISADGLCQAMEAVRQILLIEATEARARRHFADRPQRELLAEFMQRQSEGTLSFPLVGYTSGTEPWLGAWQLALDELETTPPPLPTFSRDAIAEWLDLRKRELTRSRQFVC